MLSVFPYSYLENLWQWQFLKNPHYPLNIITPASVDADAVRAQLPLDTVANVMTFSNFIQRQLPSVTASPYYAKQAVWLLAAKIFQLHGGQSVAHFQKVFQLFTSLRSFSLDWKLMSEVLTELTSQDVHLLGTFWQTMTMMNIVDEQQALALLSVKYQQRGPEGPKNLVFWGFDHFSMLQVDFLQSLGKIDDVYIPIPASVLAISNHNDWISWLDPQRTPEVTPSIPLLNYALWRFDPHRLNGVLSTIIRRNFHNQPLRQIFLAQKNPEFSHYQEFGELNVAWKIPTDFLQMDVKKYFTKLRSHSKVIVIGELKEQIEQFIAIRPVANFRELKVATMVLEIMSRWSELSDQQDTITTFVLDVWEQACLLATTRAFIFRPGSIYLGGQESIKNACMGQGTLLVASGSYQSLRGRGNVDSPAMLEKLAVLGPIRRPEMELAWAKAGVIRLLANNDAILLIERGLDKYDLFWEEICQFPNLGATLTNERHRAPARKDPLKKLINKNHQGEYLKISASKLQNFLDCPRKYYFTYLHPLQSFLFLENEISAAELGMIEHQVIGSYFSQKTSLEAVATAHLDQFIVQKQKNLRRFQREKYLQEIILLAGNGINFILHLEEQTGTMQKYFEKEFFQIYRNYQVGGKIDFMGVTPQGTVLLDFKRSGGGVPTNAQLARLEKIQLFFYLRHVGDFFGKCQMAGFVNLTQPEKSLIYQLPGELDLWTEQYRHKECELVTSLQQIQDFPATPLHANNCDYCPFRTVCHQGEA